MDTAPSAGGFRGRCVQTEFQGAKLVHVLAHKGARHPLQHPLVIANSAWWLGNCETVLCACHRTAW